MDSDVPEERSFQEREADLLRELSSLYTKLNQVREKRAKVEQETSSAASTEDTSDRRRRRRVILVTRSLPFTLTAEDAQSQWRAEFHENLTLDAAMETYMCLHETYDCVWIGSVNGEVEQSEQNTLKEQLHQDRNYYPVFLDPKREKLFYQGFCKTILWPLFHSSPPTTEDQLISQEMDNEADERNVMEKMWQAYVAVNQSFADAVQEVYEEGDLVWIQGYHLSLVPQMVRNLFPNSNIHIGFFNHTPFPSSELYRILNYREEMLTGVLGADLIGFQTYEYARHFQSSVVRLLGLESSHKGVDVDGHFARITICPVGIDPEKFTALARSDGVNDQIRQLRAQFAGKTVMLGMDQLDPTKGLVHKLLAVEELFTLRPELSREVVFVQIVTGGTHALESPLGAQVEALVSRINSKLQDIGADAPVQYLNQELPRDMLIALYALADCIVITPVQEGMNAMPFEYVVCREAVGKHARIVLSEFAGSAHSLGGAKLVNPWNTEELHDALLASLQESEGVMSAHQSMYSYVSTFTSRHWADNFLEQLEECCEENNLAVSGRELSRRDMTSAYTRSSRRLIFINYEGVMAAETSIPELSYPPQELIWQLSMLTDDPRNTVVLVCARSMAVCEQWFAGLSGRIVLAAEYGVYVKWIGENEPWRCVVPNLDLDWWEDVEPLLEYYTERTPGSFMERKDSSVTWHYRDCDQDHGLWQASELLISLRELTRSLPVAVVPGNRYLEVRPQKVSKASLFERIWEYMNYSSLFPNEEPVTTEYFGELARPSTSPVVKPNPGPPLSADRWRAKEKDELAKFRLEDSDRSSPWRRRASDTNSADPADMDESSLTDEEDQLMPSDQTVDFVVVIAAGEDRTDEDLFSVLVPPPIDLEAYCRQLDKDELRMEKKLSESALLAHEEELSMLNDGDSIRRRSSWNNNGLSASPTAPILGAGSLEDTTFIQLTPKSSFRRLLSRDNMLASVGSQGNVLDPELLPLARLPSQGTDGHSGKPTISDDAATMFPRALLATPATARRDEITEKSKFTPRRDFPPSAALFKAMKTKYGESFGMHKIPNTPAECWALVCPPTARAKLEDSTLDRKASVSSTSQAVPAVTVIKEVDEVLSEPEASVLVEGDDDELKVVVEKMVRVRSSSSRLDESDDLSEVERYLFPVNTFVCTLGRKLSQAPYYIKNSADLYQLLQEMGLSSHLRRQRLLSQNVGRSVSPLDGEDELFAGDEGEIEAEVALAAALAH